MGRTLSEVRRYGPNWDETRKQILRRDDYTCQRCGHQSGPHAGDEGRVLQVHHIEKVSDGGSNDESNLVTLCRPCHGVQHPDNDTFDAIRGYARIYPPSTADGSVAYVNSKNEREPLDSYLDRTESDYCERCGDPKSDGERFYVYPNIDFADRGSYENPAEKFGVLCAPCTGLVYAADDDDGVEKRLISTDGRIIGTSVERLVAQRDRALLSGTKKTRKFGATREAANRKEWWLFESPYRHIHRLWRRLGTAVIAAFLFVLAGPLLDGLISAVAASTSLGPSAAWFYVFAGGLIAALSLAYVLRWSVAALSDRLWHRIDGTIRPHHYRKPKLFTLRRRLGAVGGYLFVPYLVVGALHAVVLLL
jgi:hypothetical protein